MYVIERVMLQVKIIMSLETMTVVYRAEVYGRTHVSRRWGLRMILMRLDVGGQEIPQVNFAL